MTDRQCALPNESLSLEFLGTYCPVQAEGKIDGHAFYFRSRWKGWRFEVEDEVVLCGDVEEAGWMTVPDALRHIADGIEVFRAQQVKP